MNLSTKTRVMTVAEEVLPVSCRPSLQSDPLPTSNTVGSATVTEPDVIVSNGVIHLVSSVLVPQMGECWSEGKMIPLNVRNSHGLERID